MFGKLDRLFVFLCPIIRSYKFGNKTYFLHRASAPKPKDYNLHINSIFTLPSVNDNS